MKSSGKRAAALGLVGVLAGCSATGVNTGASVLGPMLSSLGLILGDIKKEYENENTLTTFVEWGPIYRKALVEKVSNVPESIRNVPIHHSDRGTPGPIPDDEVMIGSRSGMFVRYGPEIKLVEDALSLKTALELEFSGSYSTDYPKRNYTNAVGTSQRGRGAALTYYSIHTKSGPDWNSVFIPKLFAGLDIKISDSFSVSAGYSIWREDLVAETGYDRYDKLKRLAGFNLVDMTVGSVSGTLKYKHYDGGYSFLEIGMQDILDKKFHDLGRQAKIDFEENPFSISIGGSFSF